MSLKELKEVQDLEKCDRRQTDGVTDNGSTRGACASKNAGKLLEYIGLHNPHSQ